MFKWFKKDKNKPETENQELNKESQESFDQEYTEDLKQQLSENLEVLEEYRKGLEETVESVKELTNDTSFQKLEEVTEKIEHLSDNLKEESLEVKETAEGIMTENEFEEVEQKELVQTESEQEELVQEESEDEKPEQEKNSQDEVVQDEAFQEEITQEDVSQEERTEKKGFFAKIKSGLEKTRKSIMSGVEQVLSAFTTIDEELFEELEEALIMADIGTTTSLEIIDRVRELVKKERVTEVSEIKNLIVRVITEILEDGNEELVLPNPSVILVIGVNGVGKTTTIGKLTRNFKSEGKNIVLAAADTFRAAAIDQLEVWGERNDVPVIKHQENSDPAAVVYDAVFAAKSRKSDLLICDTAGRLHNKKNLMEELRKISKIVSREYSEAHVETFLVLDATTGQNALQQAKLFKEVADISGIVLTKLDGTAKGGIVIAIKNELHIPVRYIGVGEGLDDLQEFNAEDFAKALFDNE